MVFTIFQEKIYHFLKCLGQLTQKIRHRKTYMNNFQKHTSLGAQGTQIISSIKSSVISRKNQIFQECETKHNTFRQDVVLTCIRHMVQHFARTSYFNKMQLTQYKKPTHIDKTSSTKKKSFRTSIQEEGRQLEHMRAV